MRNTFNTKNTYENILTGINKEEVLTENNYTPEYKEAHKLASSYIIQLAELRITF